jgi:molybdopterin converting factor small subunit
LVTFVSGAAKFDQVGHLFTIEVERSAMTATVRIPTVLRPAMGGATTVPVEGTTIGAVLDHLTITYPAAKGQLLNDDGTLHRFLNVYVNDDDVRYLGGVDAPVLNNDEITLLPAVAGGAG